MTAGFVRLDNEIESFSLQWQEFQGPSGNKLLLGANAGLLDKLNEIETQALMLKADAESEGQLHRRPTAST